MSYSSALLAQTLRERIGTRDISFTFTRSGGPGGQNVNKVSTRAVLWFDIERSTALTDEEKTKIARRLSSRISQEGVLQVVASKHRTQAANREAATERLFELLVEALRTRKARKSTKISQAARQRRLAEKKRVGERKRLRGKSAERE